MLFSLPVSRTWGAKGFMAATGCIAGGGRSHTKCGTEVAKSQALKITKLGAGFGARFPAGLILFGRARQEQTATTRQCEPFHRSWGAGAASAGGLGAGFSPQFPPSPAAAPPGPVSEAA